MGEGGGRGCRSSRFGRRGDEGEVMIGVSSGKVVERAAWRVLWKMSPDAPSAIEWWKMKDAVNAFLTSFSVLIINRQKGREP